MHMIRHLISIAYGLPFVIIGIGHFRNPEWFEPIVPDLLGAPRFWVLVSGVFEILLGVLVFFPRTRRIASIGFVGMLFACKLRFSIHAGELIVFHFLHFQT